MKVEFLLAYLLAYLYLLAYSTYAPLRTSLSLVYCGTDPSILVILTTVN